MKIAVLTSGGVDSSVALRLLEEQDHEVTAFYLKIWLEDELTYLNQCPWEDDLTQVREVCKGAKVQLEVMSMQRAYFERVVEHCIEEVRQGRTPNPDVFCNSRIKFGLFLDQITGFDAVASGHYAITRKVDGRTHLAATPDLVKDQTYFLANLPSHKLDNILFPIGHLHKHQVRSLAQEFNLPNKDRKDSQGICFLGKFKYRDFLKHYLGTRSGHLVEQETGKIVGSHDGFWFYTPGQRSGIGLSGGPWYVVGKNHIENTVFISKNYYADDHKRDKFAISGCNWFAGKPPSQSNLEVKLRHGPNRHKCHLMARGDGWFDVILESQDQGIAVGQFAVFYDGDLCLGCGVIT